MKRLVALALAASLLRAGEVEDAIAHLEKGDVPGAGGPIKEVSPDAAVVRRIAEVAVNAPIDRVKLHQLESIPSNVQGGLGKGSYKAGARSLVELAEKIADPDDPDAVQALLDARAFQLRVASVVGETTDADAVAKLADGYVTLHEQRADGGRPLRHAIKLLRWARLPEKEGEVAAKGRALYPSEPLFRLAEFARQRESIKKGRARTELPKLLDVLAPLAQDADLDVVRFFNETVSRARQAKAKAAEYRTVPQELVGGLVADVPLGTWQFDTGQGTRAVALHQYEVGGGVVASLAFSTLENVDVKTATEAALSSAAGTVRIEGRLPKPKRKKVNRSLGAGRFFSMRGEVDGVQMTVRIHVWESKRAKGTVYSLFLRGPADGSLHPEVESILESLREKK